MLGQNAWTRDLTDTDCLEFQEETGPTFQFNTQQEREIDIFEKIFTIALLQFIVKETNLLWEDVTEIELWAYFGVLIVIGITNLPELHMYWSTDPMYGGFVLVTALKKLDGSYILQIQLKNKNAESRDMMAFSKFAIFWSIHRKTSKKHTNQGKICQSTRE